MKICVFHGSERKGNTEKTVGLVKERMCRLGEVTFTDFYLPKDLPHFCRGCFACLRTGAYGGENCPHKVYTYPMLKAMLASDGIIIASPVYAMAETAQVKSLLDHFACTYIVHRPNTEMFDKTALIVSTAAGAGTGRVIRTLRTNMTFWGIRKTLALGVNMHALNWQDMPDKKRERCEAAISAKAERFYALTQKRQRLLPNYKARAIMFANRFLVKSYADSEPDKIFWKSKGWL